MSSWLFRFLNFFVLLICLGSAVKAQKDNSEKDAVNGIKGFVARMQEFAKSSAISSAEDLAADRAEQVFPKREGVCSNMAMPGPQIMMCSMEGFRSSVF